MYLNYNLFTFPILHAFKPFLSTHLPTYIHRSATCMYLFISEFWFVCVIFLGYLFVQTLSPIIISSRLYLSWFLISVWVFMVSSSKIRFFWERSFFKFVCQYSYIRTIFIFIFSPFLHLFCFVKELLESANLCCAEVWASVERANLGFQMFLPFSYTTIIGFLLFGFIFTFFSSIVTSDLIVLDPLTYITSFHFFGFFHV